MVAAPRGLKTAERVLFLILGCWLAAAAVLVDVEYYDGFEAVANASFFLGKTSYYVANRVPLMSLLILTGEAAKHLLGLHPLDVRPHHAITALLNFGCLLFVYRLLAQNFGSSFKTLAAFFAACCTFVFFSYAPFISHDVFPGVILLAMLFLAERFRAGPDKMTWLLMVALGAAAALIKQTFAVFWVLVLVSHLGAGLPEKSGRPLRAFFLLLAGAAASGAVTWIVTGWALEGGFPDTPLLLRPLKQIQGVGGLHTGIRELLFPWWVYARNFWAYGMAAMLLVVPGLVAAMRGSRLQKTVALSWILSLGILHLLSFREVRYMAFLAPLTAFLIVPPVEWIVRRKKALALFLLILLADAAIASSEAAMIFHPFYRKNPAREFLEPLKTKGRDGRVFIDFDMLSFFPKNQDSPLAGDPYHRLFHLGWHHIMLLYGYQPAQLAFIRYPDQWNPALLQGGSCVLIKAEGTVVNGQASRLFPYTTKNLLRLSLYRDSAEGLTLRRVYTQNGGTSKLTGACP